MEQNSKIQIKGMVCNRCIEVLTDELSKLGLKISNIELGEVTLKAFDRTVDNDQKLKSMLQQNGFDLLYDKNQQLVNQIKLIIDKGIEEQIETGKAVKFSFLVSEELHKDYDSLSSFSHLLFFLWYCFFLMDLKFINRPHRGEGDIFCYWIVSFTEPHVSILSPK